MCFRRQFTRKMWTIQLVFLIFIAPWIFLLSLDLLILHFSHDRSNWSPPSFPACEKIWDIFAALHCELAQHQSVHSDERVDIFMAQQPLVGQVIIIIKIWDNIQTHHIRYDSSGRVISPTQRPVRDSTTTLTRERDIHAPSGIRTHNPCKRAAADPHFRPRGLGERPSVHLLPAE
jgi:hypothetical protein